LSVVRQVFVGLPGLRLPLFYLPTVILTIIWYSITHSLFHPRLKTFLFCKSFPPQPFLIHYMDSPDCLLLFLSIYVSYFLVFLFLHFLVVGSVQQIKLTHVGFRAHVKIASRIVSYITRTYVNSQGNSCSESRRRKRKGCGWLGSRVVSMLDSGVEGPGSNRSRDAVG